MNMKKAFAIIALLLALAANSVAQTQYYPLERGKAWIYKFGPEFSMDPDQRAKVEIRDKQEKKNGESYYVMDSYTGKGDAFTRFQTVYLRAGKDGSIYGISQGSPKEDMLLPGGTLSDGDSWSAGEGMATSESTVLSTSATISTPDGDFDNCLAIEVRIEGAVMCSYYKEGVGLVAVTTFIGEEEKVMQYLVKD
jgi:hypothetical protein